MAQIIVASDSHGNNKILEQIVRLYPNALAYLHLGDSQASEQEIYPFISVKGNNDYLITNETRIVHLLSLNIYMIHGHNMYLSKDNMVSRARLNNCNVFLYGHTHRPFYEYYEGVYILNPGALAYPRSTMGATFAIINVDDDKIAIEFKQI